MLIIDFEITRFDWLLVWYDTKTHKFHHIQNSKSNMEKFYDLYKDELMIGYNINHFDRYIMQGILCDFNPYLISDWIINQEKQGWEYSRLLSRFPINTFDTMVKDKSLKQCEASLGLKIVETSVPFDIDRKLTREEMLESIEYCMYDVKATMEVFLQDGFYLSPQDEYNSSVSICQEFGFPINYMGKTKAQLGCSVLGATRRVDTNDEFDIIIPSNLQLGKYEYVKDWFLNPLNHWYGKDVEGKKTKKKNEFVTNIAGLPHVLAWGGIHASVERKIVDGILLMCDFGSLYPNIMVNYNLVSRGVPNPDRYKELLEIRLQLKSIRDAREKCYKIALNGSYGQMKYEQSPLYDARNANNVCVTGQLIAVDLIEKLEKYGEILNSNTDGVLIKVNNAIDKVNVERVCKEVSERVRIPIDIEEYKRFIVKDVNNYIAVKPNGKFKAKGSYVKELHQLEYNCAIVNTTIRNYFINGVEVERTILGSDNIMDFQIIAKAGRKYECAYHGTNKLNERVNRVFASKNQLDGGMFKLHKIDRTMAKIESTPEHCFIINDDVREMKIPSKLDKNWYVELAKRRIKEFVL